MRQSLAFICSLLLLGITLTACNISTPAITPTPEILISDTPTPLQSPTPSRTPTLTATPPQVFEDVPVVVASPLPNISNLPTLAVTPSETPAACPVTIQEGEFLYGALARVNCGNRVGPALLDAVVAFNDNLASADSVQAGQELLVPRPTATPIPEGAPMTETAAAEQGVIIIGNQLYDANTVFGPHTVQEGESIIAIAERYNTSLEVLSQQNQNLNWSGCDFTNPSGGPNCAPNVREGQPIQVPLPTATIVPSATPSGNETATPTPTFRPGRVVMPPNGSIVPGGRVTLQWVSSGLLAAGQVYLIDIADRTTGTEQSYVADEERYTLPDDLIPVDGQTHRIEWRVSVARVVDDGSYQRIGGLGEWYTFEWRSR